MIQERRRHVRDRVMIVLAIIVTIAAVGQIMLSLVLYDSEGNSVLRNAGWGVLTISAIFGWLPMYTFRKRGA